MLINGKERHFALTVGAYFEIAEFCPEGDIHMLGDLLDDDSKALKTFIKMAVAMNKAYNDRQKWQGLETEGENLTEAELFTMPIEAMQELSAEVLSAYSMGSKTEVEIKDNKKKER